MVTLEPPKIKSVTASTFSHEVMGPDAIILVFLVEFQASFFPFHFLEEEMAIHSNIPAMRTLESYVAPSR